MKRIMKQGSRILAIDDSRFSRKETSALVIGVVGRGSLVEGVISFRVMVDGNDATAQIMKAVKKSRFMPQVKLIAMNGTVLAGLNVIDAERLVKELRVPVIAVTRKKPHPGLLLKAIRRRGDGSAKLRAVERMDRHMKLHRKDGYYMQLFGTGKEYVGRRFGEVLGMLRLARIIGSGISKGESRGRM